MSYGQPEGAAAKVAYRRVHYTAPHCGVRVLYRLGAQGADPVWRGAFKQRKMTRLGTEWGNIAMQGGDNLLEAADEAATSIETVELPRSEGPKG